jgi:maltose-binding protein MalE
MLFVLLQAIALAGCLGQDPEPIIRLTWWIPYAADSREYPAFQAITEAFTEQTGTIVELVSVPWEDIAPRGSADPRLSLLIESGDGPDLWGPVPHPWIEPYVSRDQALALDPKRIRNQGQYDDLALRASRLHGQQYALPLLMDAVALIHNRSLVPKPPSTFEQFVEVAQMHTEPNSGRWGLALPLLSPTHAYPFMAGYGGYIFRCQIAAGAAAGGDADSHEATSGAAANGSAAGDYACDPKDIGLNNAGSVQGIQLVSDLYVQERVLSSVLADRSQMHQGATQLFIEGKAAMLIDGPWVVSALRESEIDYGVAPLPVLPGASVPPRPLTVVHVLTASAYTGHPDQVLQLMNAIAAPESIASLSGALNKAPVRRDGVRQSQLEHTKTWRDQASQGVLLPPLPELDVVWTPWARALAEAIPGLRPVQEAMDQAVEQIKESLGQQGTLGEGS